MQANYKQRLRLHFGKDEPARYIGHLDLARTLERAIKRGRLPLAYTQGFNPRARLAFADALPLGYTSEWELVDFWLKETRDVDEAAETLTRAMAPGITVKFIEEIPLSSPALQTITKSARYSVVVKEHIQTEELRIRLTSLLNQLEIPRTRRDKKYDLRPLILDLQGEDRSTGELAISMALVLESGKVGRPDEVLAALEIDPRRADFRRTHIELAELEDSE